MSDVKDQGSGTRSGKALLWLGGGVIAVVLAGLIGWRLFAPKAPTPDADPVRVAEFVASSQFKNLPEAEKRPYMKAMRSKAAALEEAARGGRLSREQYHAAYLNGWLERQLDHMDDYYKQPEARRQQYLVEEYARKSKTKDKGAAKTDDIKPGDDAEEAFVAERIKSWTKEERAKWEEFQQAVDKAKAAASRLSPSASTGGQ